MLFKNNANFMNNYLARAVPSTIKRNYEYDEYWIYNYLQELYERNSSIAEDDVERAIRLFRQNIADSIISIVKNEYPDQMDRANEIMRGLAEANYNDINKLGPDISCVYLAIIQSFAGVENSDQFGPAFASVVEDLEAMESHIINNSLEILVSDKMLDEKIGGKYYG